MQLQLQYFIIEFSPVKIKLNSSLLTSCTTIVVPIFATPYIQFGQIGKLFTPFLQTKHFNNSAKCYILFFDATTYHHWHSLCWLISGNAAQRNFISPLVVKHQYVFLLARRHPNNCSIIRTIPRETLVEENYSKLVFTTMSTNISSFLELHLHHYYCMQRGCRRASNNLYS